MSNLPKNWEYGKLSQAANVVRGITFPAGEKQNDLAHGYVCCLRTTNVQQKLEWDNVYYVPTSYVKRDEQFVREGDVLMSMANSYELVGKVARAINVPQPAAFGAFLAAVRPTNAIDGGYLYHFLRSSKVQSKLREGSSQTTNIANISVGKLSELTVPLAPLNEQKRIAEKLDSVLARVDAVDHRLACVALLLKRFRQSVLSAVTSGKLTEEWRGRRGYHQKAEPLDATGRLPGSWRAISIEELKSSERYSLSIGPFGSNLTTKDYTDRGVPLVFVREIRARTFGDQRTKYVAVEKAAELSAHMVSSGDILITKMGDPPGDVAIYPASKPNAIITADCIKLRVNPALVDRVYMAYALESPAFKKVLSSAVAGVAQQKVSLARFRVLPVAIPPLEEQTEIVSRVELLFGYAERLEARLHAAQTAADRLTPALLAKAFRGELVPQDPNDEPASELLRRLQQEAPSTSTTRGRKGTA